MAVIRYSSFDLTVNDIAERNAIVNRVNHMTVVVKDAIADVSAGQGKAIYRWDAVDNVWILVSSGSTGSISFITEEIQIIDGNVVLSNYPINNLLWNLSIVENDLIFTEPRISDLNIFGLEVSGLSDYNTKYLRCTYAYGSMAQQVDAIMNTKVSIFTQNEVPNNPKIGDFWLDINNSKFSQYRCVDFANLIFEWIEV